MAEAPATVMSNNNEQTSVETFEDHEVITPPNRLRVYAYTVTSIALEDDPVARAVKALEALSSEFSSWMDQECARLDAARLAVHKAGFDKMRHQALFHAAHDIKGGAPTLGFPAAFGAADSLCRLLEHTPEMVRIPLPLVDKHVDAVRAIVRESGQDGAEHTAATLTERLREITDEFLAGENKDRPDHLDAIMTPPIAPA